MLGSVQTYSAVQSHQSWGPGAGCFGLLHIRILPDIDGRYNRDQPGVNVEMCVQRDQSPGGESSNVHHIKQVWNHDDELHITGIINMQPIENTDKRQSAF